MIGLTLFAKSAFGYKNFHSGSYIFGSIVSLMI